MEGFGPSTYGDAFADVYDDWYDEPGTTEASAGVLADLAAGVGGGAVLELGVGTGRLALALAARGLEVHGVDASAAMLDRLRAKTGAEAIHLVQADFADVPVDGVFAVVIASYNTLFNLPDEAAQRRCVAAAAERLVPGGAFVVEGFVPDPGAPTAAVTPRTVEVDRVVLHATLVDHAGQTVRSQHITLTAAGVELRPSFLRWATPGQLDAMAAGAGLVLAQRWAGWRQEPFTADSGRHVSVYRSGASVATTAGAAGGTFGAT